jgi:hypothetical protein
MKILMGSCEALFLQMQPYLIISHVKCVWHPMLIMALLVLGIGFLQIFMNLLLNRGVSCTWHWPPLPPWIGSYSFKDIKEAQDEVNTMAYFLRKDSRGIIMRMSLEINVAIASIGGTTQLASRRSKSTTEKEHATI